MKRVTLAATLSAALLASSASAAEKPLQIEMIDVEGGAATLFVTPEGQSLLVDTGWKAGAPKLPEGVAPGPTSAERILAAAAKLGVSKIDVLLITHYHDDHIGGFAEVISKIPVGTVIDHGPNREMFTPRPNRPTPPANHPSVTYPPYAALADRQNRRTIKAGDQIDVGALSLHVVAADGALIDKPLVPKANKPTTACDTVTPRAADQTENGRSVGFVATYGKARILALADVTWDLELKLVCPTNLLGPTDLLLVSHHGAPLSNSPPLFAATAPRVALLNNGARKGGDKATMQALADTPSKPPVWQLHEVSDKAFNRPADFIANPEGGPDGAYPLQAEIYRSGAIKVTNTRNGFSQTYPARR